MHLGDQTAVNGNEIVNLFTDFFNLVYEERPFDNSVRMPQVGNIMKNFQITNKDITDTFSSIKSCSSSGPDGFHPVFDKSTNNSLLIPLLFILNLCLKTSIYPQLWKCSFLAPNCYNQCT